MARGPQVLIAVVGETASGKSALGLQIALKFNGEIICADSATVRRGLDIGTAKPTPDERALVPHHLLDIIEPNQRFTAADFKRLATRAAKDITRRGKLPIMVGGTGLYIDSVLYDYSFGVQGQPDRQQIRPGSLVLGIKTERPILTTRIEARVDAMLAAGLEAEVRRLSDRYGWSCLGLKNVGYAQWQDYFNGQKNLAQTRADIIKSTVELAKRQRNNSIQWFMDPVKMTEIVDSVTTFLNT